MSAHVLLGGYVAIGVAAAIHARIRGAPALQTASMIALWPFLLPALNGPRTTPAQTSTDGARLAALEKSLEAAWAEVAALGAGRATERERMGRFVSHLRTQVARLEEMDRALTNAADRLRGPLAQLRARTAAEVGEGLVLLEELVAQLTLLRFTGGPGGEAARHEKDHVEALLARIGALAEVSAAS